jgi:hypothetical protein
MVHPNHCINEGKKKINGSVKEEDEEEKFPGGQVKHIMINTKPLQRINSRLYDIGTTVFVEKPGIEILVVSRKTSVFQFFDLLITVVKAHGKDAVIAGNLHLNIKVFFEMMSASRVGHAHSYAFDRANSRGAYE